AGRAGGRRAPAASYGAGGPVTNGKRRGPAVAARLGGRDKGSGPPAPRLARGNDESWPAHGRLPGGCGEPTADPRRGVLWGDRSGWLTIPGTGISLGWLFVLLGVYRLWGSYSFFVQRRHQEEAWRRREAASRSGPPPLQEPDPNFDFNRMPP